MDFSQDARDQGCLHIALKGLGEGSGALAGTVGKVLRNMAPVQLQEPKGTVLFLRFIDEDKLPSWASTIADGASAPGRSRWEQFSAHKDVLGLLCVAQCLDAEDLKWVRGAYKDSCEARGVGLCASRCIVYGHKKSWSSAAEVKDGLVYVEATLDELDIISEDVKPPVIERVANDLAQSIFRALKSKADELFRIVSDTSRADVLRHLKAPMELGSQEDSEQRCVCTQYL